MPPIMHDMKEALCVVQTSLAASEPDAWHGVGHACAVRKQGSPARALKNISYAIQATATHTISASVLVNRLPRRARPAPCQRPGASLAASGGAGCLRRARYRHTLLSTKSRTALGRAGPEHACMACMRSMQTLTTLTGQVRKGLHALGAGDPAPVQVQLGARAARLQLRQRPGQAGEHPQDQPAVKDRDRQHLRAQGGAWVWGGVGWALLWTYV